MDKGLPAYWDSPRLIGLFRDAVKLRQEGKPELGLPLAEQILRDYPDDVVAHMLKGSLLYAAEEFEAAAVSFRQVLQRNFEHERATQALFLSLAFSGQFAEAVKEMERFLERRGSKNFLQVCRDYPDQFDQVFEGELNLDDFPRVRAYLDWNSRVELPPGRDWFDIDDEQLLPPTGY